MKKIITASICAVFIVALGFCLGGREYSRTEYMMDTVITITADKREAVDKCFDEVKRLENLLGAYIKGSDVWRINQSPSGAPVKVAPETAELIEKANEIKKLTAGAFDISIKPLVDLWNIKGGGYVPQDAEIDMALSLVGDIAVDRENLTVTLLKDGMKIDLGGIAKGYVGDKVREILIANDVKSALVDLGGNIVTVGKNGNKPWYVGLQNPTESRGMIFASVPSVNNTVVTSGGYERYFEKNGQAYHHIIDPATGKNPENDVLSVTIISEDGTLADAFSTACFVLGKDKGMELAEKCGVDAVFYTGSGQVYHTPDLELN